jgi:hypothetical protein
MTMNDDEVVWWMNLEDDPNLVDLFRSALKGELFGIVTNKDGGIIAYAIGTDHAEQIVDAIKFKEMALDAAFDAEGKFGHDEY